jgi:hypothetical protein
MCLFSRIPIRVDACSMKLLVTGSLSRKECVEDCGLAGSCVVVWCQLAVFASGRPIIFGANFSELDCEKSLLGYGGCAVLRLANSTS